MKSKRARIAVACYLGVVVLFTALALYFEYVKLDPFGGIPLIVITLPWSVALDLLLKSTPFAGTRAVLAVGAVINAALIYWLMKPKGA